MKSKKIAIAIGAALLTMGISTQAALLAYEGFDGTPVGNYEGSPLTGTGFSGYTLISTAKWRIDSVPGLDYIDQNTNALIGIGNAIGEWEGTGPNTRGINFHLSDPITNGTVYISFIADLRLVTDSYGLSFGMDNFYLRTAMSSDYLQAVEVSSGTSSSIQTTISDAVGKHFIVMEITGIGGVGTATVWSNPPDLASLGANSGHDFDTVITSLNDFFFSMDSLDAMAVDEIRVGTTAADVMPYGAPPAPPSNIVEYQMNDDAGTTLGGLQQDGWAAGAFGGTESYIAADGNGSLVFSNASDGNAWKGLDIGTLYTNGQYDIEFRIDAWDLSAAPDNSGFAIGLYENGTGGAIKNIRFQAKTGVNAVQLSSEAWVPDPGTPGDGGAAFLPLSSTTGIVIKASYDLDAGLYSLDWKYDTDAEFSNITLGNIGSEPNFDKMQWTIFKGTAWGVGQHVDVDYLVLGANGVAYGPSALFDSWLTDYPGVGASTGQEDDPDFDGVNNLREYALGGNPVDGNDSGIAGLTGATLDGGTNYLEYVYAQRNDATLRGLAYTLEQTDDLITGIWTTSGTLEVVGIGSIDSEFAAVTNRIPTDAEANQFLKMTIESSF